MKTRTHLYFPDLVLLKVIAVHSENGVGAPITKLKQLANDWLAKNGVPDRYAPPFTSNSQRDFSVLTLQHVGLVEHLGINRGYAATDKGRKLINDLGADWEKWYLAIPIVKRELDISSAKDANDYWSE